MRAQKESTAVDVFNTVNNTINYIVEKPIRASLEVQLRPEFTFQHNIRDTTLQILMQFCLMGNVDAIEQIRKAVNPSEYQDDGASIPEETVSTLYKLFDEAAKSAGNDDAEKIAALKKLKKYIHAYAELIGAQLKSNEVDRIVNLKKLKERFEKNKNDEDEKALAILRNENKLNQTYVVVKNIAPITTEENKQKRKTAKSRINRSSFAISVIVGIGEGMIAVVFAAATLPFLPALLAVGIPALLYNYFLFRGASFSVMKDIYFGKSTDDKKTKTLKGVSTFFSAAAGLTYGFLSYGSASIAFGHLLFGLTAAAALAAPPVGLIVLALVIAAVTAVAVTTLYDYTIRGFIDKGIKKTLLKLKNDFVDFFKPENGKPFRELSLKEKAQHVAKKCLQTVVHITFYAIAIAISAVVICTILPIMRHKATSIFHETFHIANQLAHKLSLAITIGLGSLVNGLFYAKSVFVVADTVKKFVYAVTHPGETVEAVKQAYHAATANAYTKVQSLVTGFKRLFLFGTVVMNSVVGQGVGASESDAAIDTVSAIIPGVSDAIVEKISAASMSIGSGGANGLAVVGATRGITFFSPCKSIELPAFDAKKEQGSFFSFFSHQHHKPRIPAYNPNDAVINKMIATKPA